MKLKNYLITGDTHAIDTPERLDEIKNTMPEYKPEETALIILGDAAFNFYLNHKDRDRKKLCNSYGYTIYCVRGNHEQRPELIDTIALVYDMNVGNFVWYEPDYPYIRYLHDGYVYNFGKYRALVIGGAYSVDKYYRLSKGWTWFEGELLTPEEMINIENEIFNTEVDFVFTHTCPISWEPRDLFLPTVDQSTVDKSMEIWLDSLKNKFSWKIWCFGHFHADRFERPHVEQYYQNIENLDTIYNFWCNDNENEVIPYRIMGKSPNFYVREVE